MTITVKFYIIWPYKTGVVIVLPFWIGTLTLTKYLIVNLTWTIVLLLI